MLLKLFSSPFHSGDKGRGGYLHTLKDGKQNREAKRNFASVSYSPQYLFQIMLLHIYQYHGTLTSSAPKTVQSILRPANIVFVCPLSTFPDADPSIRLRLNILLYSKYNDGVSLPSSSSSFEVNSAIFSFGVRLCFLTFITFQGIFLKDDPRAPFLSN